jgi:hypothetical protein
MYYNTFVLSLRQYFGFESGFDPDWEAGSGSRQAKEVLEKK